MNTPDSFTTAMDRLLGRKLQEAADATVALGHPPDCACSVCCRARERAEHQRART